jgi:hypothetical protein
VLDGAHRDDAESRFDDNYAFFRSQIRADEAPGSGAACRSSSTSRSPSARRRTRSRSSSLNSTGEPLRDHELIHNYVLMGLSHAEQQQVEDEFWLPMPIERRTARPSAPSGATT